MYSTHHSERLHRNHGRNFQRREHHNFGEKGFEQAPQMKARRGGAEQDGRSLRDLISGKGTQAIENAADERGLQSGAGGRRRLQTESAAEFFFDVVIEGEHAQAAVIGEQGTDQSTGERLAGSLDQQDWILGGRGSIEQGLEDGGKVADGNLLAQELL